MSGGEREKLRVTAKEIRVSLGSNEVFTIW
jgi:hypothetical protein